MFVVIFEGLFSCLEINIQWIWLCVFVILSFEGKNIEDFLKKYAIQNIRIYRKLCQLPKNLIRFVLCNRALRKMKSSWTPYKLIQNGFIWSLRSFHFTRSCAPSFKSECTMQLWKCCECLKSMKLLSLCWSTKICSETSFF